MTKEQPVMLNEMKHLILIKQEVKERDYTPLHPSQEGKGEGDSRNNLLKVR